MLPAEVSADGEYRERFNREADIAATLWHPHIVGVHDRGEFDGQMWISMDYVEGTDAGRLLQERSSRRDAGRGGRDHHCRRRCSRLRTPAQPAAPGRQARQHPVGQPGVGDERILLADFGIARWADDISGLTATNMTVGTVSYAAPEQLMGHTWTGGGSVRAGRHRLSPADGFAPVPAFESGGGDQPASVGGAAGDRRAPPGTCRVDPVLAKALAKDPKDRYERCADFAHALGHRLDTAASDSGATRLSARRATTQRPERRSPLRAGVVVPAVLAVLLGRRDRRGGLRVPSCRPAENPTPTATVCDRRHRHRITPVPPTTGRRPRDRCTRSRLGGHRRQLLPGGKHRHHRRRLDRILLDAAEHRRDDLVAHPG